jgi:hypothetical protein
MSVNYTSVMARWLKRTLVISGTLALVISGVVIVARQQPLAANVQRLRLGDCALPCWMGITPGQTVRNAAIQQLAPLSPVVHQDASFTVSEGYASEHESILAVTLRSEGVNFPIELTSIRGVVMGIRIPSSFRSIGAPTKPNEIMPTLGDIVGLLGVPTCIAARKNYRGWLLVYEMPPNEIVVTIEGDSRDMSRRITNLWLHSPFLGTTTCQSQAGVASQWMGFTTLERYLR